jgi:hypothetical protein
MRKFTGLKVCLIGLVVFLQAAPICTASAGLEEEEIEAIVTTTELVVGTNRFAFGLRKGGKLIEGADVKLRLYSVDRVEIKLVSELDVPYHTIAKVAQERAVHDHAGGTAQAHGGDLSVRGVYSTQLSFSRAGDWGIELVISEKTQPVESVRFLVTVIDTPRTTVIGSAAPGSDNLIVGGVNRLRQIDAGPKREPKLHRARSADVVAEVKRG